MRGRRHYSCLPYATVNNSYFTELLADCIGLRRTVLGSQNIRSALLRSALWFDAATGNDVIHDSQHICNVDFIRCYQTHYAYET